MYVSCISTSFASFDADALTSVAIPALQPVCNTPQKCVFVRVVDSCAGCAADSKHVDLTKAAFKSLADLEKGLLTVQMREASDPKDGWCVFLIPAHRERLLMIRLNEGWRTCGVRKRA